MRIALINLPSPALAEPWSNFPLGLGYIAAAIEKRDYDVTVLDFCEGIGRIVEADIYGMQITAPQVHSAKALAKIIKRMHPHSIVVGGGPQMAVDTDYFLYDPHFDAIVIDEGEFSFYELIRQYESTGTIEEIYWNPPIKLLDDIPFPARHLFPNFVKNAQRTHQLLKGDYTDGGQTTIIASRGCPFKCSFCAPHSFTLRYRTPYNVISELHQIVEQFGIKQFKWQDDTFTLNKKWILELCRMIKRELSHTYHRAHTRVDVFDEQMAAAMANANFKVLCFGIESFSQRLLDLNTKKITIEQIERSFKIAKNYGFKTVGFLIFGMPGENKESVEETKRSIIKNKQYLDYLNLATMVPLMGTPMYDNPEKFGAEILEYDSSKYWIVDHDNNDDVLVTSEGVPESEMKKLKVDMYQFLKNEGFARPEWKI